MTWRGKNETAHIIAMMKATGNRPGIIAQWKGAVEDWARKQVGNADAEAVKTWLPLWQPRPFYTAEELAPMWPALAIATGYTNHWPNVLKSAARLENELDFHRLPRLSYCRRYFICERIRYWQDANDHTVMKELQNALG
jgi:hypothetical protein